MPEDVTLSTSLIDMYAKCGNIDAAFFIFGSMPKKNLVTWNSIIGGYARHGFATRALETFDRMTKCGVRPDEVTFTNVLSACGHGGMVEEGRTLFNSMKAKFGIEPQVEHYACMVDLYGKAGELEEAEKLIQGMPFQPDVVVWGALLGACGLHSSLELGEFAANELDKLKSDHPAIYSTLSRIHGEKGVWNELRHTMKDKGGQKQNAGSWVESPLALR
jgi:pentatricopeptide repeat protein